MTVQEYLAQVDEAYDSLHGKEIGTRLKAILDRCGDEYGTESSAYASLLSEVGSYYRGQRDYPLSADYFTQALAVLEKTEGTRSPEYATALNNLAGTYRAMGCFEKAEPIFHQALDVYEQTLGKDHVLYAAALNNLSLLFLENNDPDTAERYLMQAGDILARLPDKQDEYATHLVNTGNLFLQRKQTEKARRFLSRAIALYEDRLGTDTPHYHAALNSLGIACCLDGDYAEARRHLEKASAACAALYDEDHAEYRAIGELLRYAEMKEKEHDGSGTV